MQSRAGVTCRKGVPTGTRGCYSRPAVSTNPPPPPQPTDPGPPPAAAPPPPPPPPPPGPPFDAAAQARTLFSQLDPTGYRPTAIVAGIILALFFGSQLFNALIPVSAVGPGVPGPGGQGPVGPGPTIGPGPGPGPTIGPGPGPGPTIGPGPGPLTTPLPPGSTLTVGPLRIPLENGWVPQDVPGSNIVLRLVKGSAAVDFFSVTIEGQADPATIYNFYMSSLQDQGTGFGATQPNLLQIGAGIPAARGSYTGLFGQSQVEGEVTTIALGSQGWIFDAWADAGALRPLLPEAQRMLDNLQVVQ